jgi:hypothetical protein
VLKGAISIPLGLHDALHAILWEPWATKKKRQVNVIFNERRKASEVMDQTQAWRGTMPLRYAADPEMVTAVTEAVQQHAAHFLGCSQTEIYVKDLVVLNRQVGADDDDGATELCDQLRHCDLNPHTVPKTNPTYTGIIILEDEDKLNLYGTYDPSFKRWVRCACYPATHPATHPTTLLLCYPATLLPYHRPW